MKLSKLDDGFSATGQLEVGDLAELKELGYRAIICNRPDGEKENQPNFATIAAAANKAGLEARHIPFTGGKITDEDVASEAAALRELPGPIVGYCGGGMRAATIWALANAKQRSTPELLLAAKNAGYDLGGRAANLAAGGRVAATPTTSTEEVLIIGGGAGGIAVAASLKNREPSLGVTIIEPSGVHYYQPGWTMVGGGIFDAAVTARTVASLIPAGVKWIKTEVVAFDPAGNAVICSGGRKIGYRRLIVTPGLKLNWEGVEGLNDALGHDGVTSNYRYDLAPYTWQLVQSMDEGRAIFTQPPMPIKCAGAPQKAMYLSADAWRRRGQLRNIDIHFCNAGGVLFSVPDYVPALMQYVDKYNISLDFFHNLIAIDGAARKATFKVSKPDTEPTEVTMEYDMIHVCPPQCAPDFIRSSPLADAAGWLSVDHHTLRHTEHDNIWALGDVLATPNAKTAAAVRKQAPTVADNVIADIGGGKAVSGYGGYGSCPLTVERGKIVLAEFAYGAKLQPTFPKAIIDGLKPTSNAWRLKADVLPWVYWNLMLKGKEWLAKPQSVDK